MIADNSALKAVPATQVRELCYHARTLAQVCLSLQVIYKADDALVLPPVLRALKVIEATENMYRGGNDG